MFLSQSHKLGNNGLASNGQSQKRIGVMMGGLSAEKDISLKSGMAVFGALKNSGFNVVPIEIIHETEEEIRRFIRQQRIDVVFVAMHGGFGEDGRLQHILEKINIPYTGPSEESSRIAMDKIISRKLFKKAGLCVPAYRRLLAGKGKFWAEKFLRYPVVVKPSSQGSSIGISFVDSPSLLRTAIKAAFEFGNEVLIEEFIKGREVTVSVLDGRALPVVEIVTKKQFFDFQAKYEKGLTEYVVPALLDNKVACRAKRDAVLAYNALKCRHLSRVDIIIKDNGIPCVLEVNTIPGMTETSLLPKAAKAEGLSFEQLCEKIVGLALNGKK